MHVPNDTTEVFTKIRQLQLNLVEPVSFVFCVSDPFVQFKVYGPQPVTVFLFTAQLI